MTKTVKEYEEAPSGSVYFYNYKEPLMSFKEGFGFEGALIFDATSDKIQCHFCGEWFHALGNHLHREHNMTAQEYKKNVGLNKTSALISETLRTKLIAKGLEKRMKNLRPTVSHSKATRLKISNSLRENRMEKQNQNNTCPEQLLERLVTIYNKLGRTPRFHGSYLDENGTYIRSEVPFVDALTRVYGSIQNACAMAGIPYRSPGQTVRNMYAKDVNKEKSINFIREFYEKEGRLPKWKEWNKSLYAYISKNRINKKKLIAAALSQDGIFKKVNFIVHYDKDTLIDFLRIFEKRNGRYPSISDCKRGLLPHYSKYRYHFGKWKTVLKIAFPDYKFIPKSRKEYGYKKRNVGLNSLQRMSLRLDTYRKNKVKI